MEDVLPAATNIQSLRYSVCTMNQTKQRNAADHLDFIDTRQDQVSSDPDSKIYF